MCIYIHPHHHLNPYPHPLSPPQMTDVELWDVTNPNLYTVTVALETGQSGHHSGQSGHIGQSGQCSGHPQSVGVVDAVNVTVGVRSVDFDPDLGLLVNKRPVKMRGFCGE